jgi:hypothetical protein
MTPNKEFLSYDDKSRQYPTFGHDLSNAIDYRALSFLGIKIFNFLDRSGLTSSTVDANIGNIG